MAWGLLYTILIFAVSAIPLNIAVKLLGGKSSWFKAIAVNVLVSIAGYFIAQFIDFFSTIVSFIVLLLIYKVMFKLGWIRALLAWLVQLILIAIFWIVVFLVLGTALLF